ncbi:MAG: hypothetical protein N3D85_04950 [Candidatus Bathyarchaeota archaeon]|nr:hypothetical protein [Candidatus Bathyarchaeota archaeon]
MQTQINSAQDLNKQVYLQAIADHIVTSPGSPIEWGASGETPTVFGLASSDIECAYALDVDKLSRLSSENLYALSYIDLSKSARLTNLAFGVSLSQMLNVDIALSDNSTGGDYTTYTFTVSVSHNTAGIQAKLRGYIVCRNFVGSASNSTSASGVGYLTIQVPATSNGAALFVVFARALFDERITAYGTYSFGHLAANPQPNPTFLNQSPLNYSLTVSSNYPTVAFFSSIALSYSYAANLTFNSPSSYIIPEFLDKSPIVVVTTGTNGTETFAEWVSYPQLPQNVGADFSSSEQNLFVYPVTVRGTLYKLTICFGDIPK